MHYLFSIAHLKASLREGGGTACGGRSHRVASHCIRNQVALTAPHCIRNQVALIDMTVKKILHHVV